MITSNHYNHELTNIHIKIHSIYMNSQNYTFELSIVVCKLIVKHNIDLDIILCEKKTKQIFCNKVDYLS